MYSTHLRENTGGRGEKDVDQMYPMYTRCWSDVEMLYTAVDGVMPMHHPMYSDDIQMYPGEFQLDSKMHVYGTTPLASV